MDNPELIAYFPEAFGLDTPVLAVANLDGTPMSLTLIYSIISELEASEDLPETNITFTTRAHHQAELTEDMPTCAILFGLTESGENIAILKTRKDIPPNTALKQIQDFCKENMTSIN